MYGYTEESWYQEHSCSHDVNLKIKSGNGSISIKTWSQPKVVIKATKIAKEKELNAITIKSSLSDKAIHLNTVYTDNTIVGTVHYDIMMPLTASLSINAHETSIKIKRLEGVLDITTQGDIDIRQACNSINAHAGGSIHVHAYIIPLQSTIRLHASDSLELLVPSNTNANLYALSENSTVQSTLYVTVRPFTTKLNQQAWDRFKKEIRGSLGNGGDASLHLQAANGIKILEL